MILFTAGGELAKCFNKLYNCQIISARRINDYELSQWITKSNVIIHNSALINSTNLSELVDSNFILTKRIIDIAFCVNPAVKFINLSSMSILKFHDEYLNPEEMTNYAFSKYISELYCIKHQLKNVTNIRFSTIFYGNETKDGISKLIYDSVLKNEITIYNGGEAKRDIIPVKILSQYLFNISNNSINKRTLNIASGKQIKFHEIVTILKSLNANLIVNNLIMETKEVLSDFSLDDIEEYGTVDYDLAIEIANYTKELNESFNL